MPLHITHIISKLLKETVFMIYWYKVNKVTFMKVISCIPYHKQVNFYWVKLSNVAFTTGAKRIY